MLAKKIDNALDEARILVLGAQVLLGFQYSGVFQKGFEGLPEGAKYVQLAGLPLLLIGFGLLTSPAPYHHIAARGQDRPDFHQFITIVIAIALLPFAVSLGFDLFIATQKLLGTAWGVAAGTWAAGVALFFWYVLEFSARRTGIDQHGGDGASVHQGSDDKGEEQEGKAGMELKEKVKKALTEARVVLPGAQALLGFQFTVILTEGFDKLPESSKYVHLASLALIAFTTVLLITPAAYHRIVERGEDSEHFVRFASRIVLAAMVPLALGLVGDLYVVVQKVTGSAPLGVTAAAIMLVFFYGLWFGYTALVRTQRQPQ